MDRNYNRLLTEYAGSDKVLDVADLWSCFMPDVVMNVVFCSTTKFISVPELQVPVHRRHTQYGKPSPYHAALWLDSDRFTELLFPPFKTIIEFREEMTRPNRRYPGWPQPRS